MVSPLCMRGGYFFIIVIPAKFFLWDHSKNWESFLVQKTQKFHLWFMCISGEIFTVGFSYPVLIVISRVLCDISSPTFSLLALLQQYFFFKWNLQLILICFQCYGACWREDLETAVTTQWTTSLTIKVTLNSVSVVTCAQEMPTILLCSM